jgi:hypothetical protein
MVIIIPPDWDARGIVAWINTTADDLRQSGINIDPHAAAYMDCRVYVEACLGPDDLIVRAGIQAYGVPPDGALPQWWKCTNDGEETVIRFFADALDASAWIVLNKALDNIAAHTGGEH